MNSPKAKAWIITIIIHAILIAVMLLIKYQLPAQPVYQEDLLEVDLGTSDDGFGDDQPEYMDGPAPTDVASASQSSSNNNSSTTPSSIPDIEGPDVVKINQPKSPTPNQNINPRSNNRLSTSNNSSNNNNNTNANNNTSSTTTNNNRRARYTYDGGQGEGGNSASRNNPGGSQGDGSGSGDKGVPGGVVGGSYINAVPNLKGRSLKTKPDPKATFNEGGTVVVRVTVNRSGKILRHSIVSATNSTIQNIVLQKLRQVSFTELNDAPPEQSGTITFTFKTAKK